MSLVLKAVIPSATRRQFSSCYTSFFSSNGNSKHSLRASLTRWHLMNPRQRLLTTELSNPITWLVEYSTLDSFWVEWDLNGELIECKQTMRKKSVYQISLQWIWQITHRVLKSHFVSHSCGNCLHSLLVTVGPAPDQQRTRRSRIMAVKRWVVSDNVRRVHTACLGDLIRPSGWKKNQTILLQVWRRINLRTTIYLFIYLRIYLFTLYKLWPTAGNKP